MPARPKADLWDRVVRPLANFQMGTPLVRPCVPSPDQWTPLVVIAVPLEQQRFVRHGKRYLYIARAAVELGVVLRRFQHLLEPGPLHLSFVHD